MSVMATNMRLRFYVADDGTGKAVYTVTITYEPRNPPPGWQWPADMPEFVGTGKDLQAATSAAWSAYHAANPQP